MGKILADRRLGQAVNHGKKEITRIVEKAGKSFFVPKKKFVLEMMTGMLATGQCNVTRIAAGLKEGMAVKDT